MEAKETLEEYYIRLCKPVPPEFGIHGANAAHFNILKRGNCFTTLNFARRDYYKIVLTRGKALLQTEKGEVLIDKPALFFSDRNIRFGGKICLKIRKVSPVYSMNTLSRLQYASLSVNFSPYLKMMYIPFFF